MKPARTRLIAVICLAMQVAWGCCGSASGALLCWNAWLCACEGRPVETDCCGRPLKPAAPATPAMPSCCSGGDGACTCCVRVPTAPARTDHSNSRTSVSTAFDAAPAQPAPAFGWSPDLHLPTGTFALSAAPDPVAARCAFAVTTTHLII